MLSRITNALRRRWRVRSAMSEAREASIRRVATVPIQRVLVVCYGNIYRSPFCGQLLRGMLPADLEVRTSGFHQKTGRASPQRHVAMSLERQVDLSGHRSSRVTAADLDWADIIVLMDRHNWNALDEAGADPEKLVWLGAFADGPLEVADPYGLDDAHAQKVLDQMESASRELAARLAAGYKPRVATV